ncbi:pentapeptide repeat-containing protein [Micromonosporaceae bacterium DT194]|uniref:pentapeptide repeat-containing protein n=1 Tax=Melissospora conviva TaxID=3388432 RepID=UPI003C190A0F
MPFRNVRFRGARFRGARFRGARFRRVPFRGVRFRPPLRLFLVTPLLRDLLVLLGLRLCGPPGKIVLLPPGLTVLGPLRLIVVVPLLLVVLTPLRLVVVAPLRLVVLVPLRLGILISLRLGILMPLRPVVLVSLSPPLPTPGGFFGAAGPRGSPLAAVTGVRRLARDLRWIHRAVLGAGGVTGRRGRRGRDARIGRCRIPRRVRLRGTGRVEPARLRGDAGLWPLGGRTGPAWRLTRLRPRLLG